MMMRMQFYQFINNILFTLVLVVQNNNKIPKIKVLNTRKKFICLFDLVLHPFY